MATPSITLSLSGKNIITEYNSTATFNVATKKEQTYGLNSTDSAETIDISDISNIAYMIFESVSPFDLTITTSTPETITIPVKSLFVLSPMPSFTALITAITIKATTSADQLINVRIYGVA